MKLEIKDGNIYSDSEIIGTVDGSTITLPYDRLKDWFMRRTRLHFKRPEDPRGAKELYKVVTKALKERNEKSLTAHEQEVHSLNAIILSLEDELGRERIKSNTLQKQLYEQAAVILGSDEKQA